MHELAIHRQVCLQNPHQYNNPHFSIESRFLHLFVGLQAAACWFPDLLNLQRSARRHRSFFEVPFGRLVLFLAFPIAFKRGLSGILPQVSSGQIFGVLALRMSGAGAWFRTMLHQEPIIMWSCIIGGIGARHLRAASSHSTTCSCLCSSAMHWKIARPDFLRLCMRILLFCRYYHTSGSAPHPAVLLKAEEHQPTTSEAGDLLHLLLLHPRHETFKNITTWAKCKSKGCRSSLIFRACFICSTEHWNPAMQMIEGVTART